MADGTFVFADISGFTKLSEQLAELGKAGAEELTVLLNATFESLLGVARDEGGDLVKFGGDALFLFFQGEHHAARACRAAHGMRAALKARGPVVTGKGRVVLKISMGAHSGPFLFVLAGDEQRELFVLGEHATVVTDMESTADAGEILVSRATAALLPASWRGAAKGEGVLLRKVDDRDLGGAAAAAPDELPPELLQPLVPAPIRRRVDDGEHGAEHRRTTVAFVHVGGIDDEVRANGPEAVTERLHAIVRAATAAATRHGVALLATDVAGGGVKLILTAGVPDAVEDGEGRMMAVGRALLDADFGLPVRVGVNTGHVFAGEVGAPWRRVYTVIGDAVNLSARFMAKASHGQMVANRITVDQSATRFVTTPLEPFMVKGKRHPQHAYAVGDRIEGRGRDAATAGRFVGRAAELAQLTTALESALAGAGRCTEILGEPGIGKSRLVHEVMGRAGDARVVRLTCEPFAADRPYFMARLLLRVGLGIPLDVAPREAGEALLAWLDEHQPEHRPWAPLLAIAIDAEVPSTREVDDLGADFRVARLRTVAGDVMRRAFARPMLLVVEDAMWMDEASAGMVAAALQRLHELPWYCCFTTRDRAEGLGGELGFASDVMTLEALTDDLSVALAADLTEDASVPPDELRELVTRAKGNPLFLVELAHARRELGSLDAIPGSLEDLIAARIDRLAPADRNLLRHAAVLGDRFAPRLFDRTLGEGFPSPVPWQRLADFIITDQGELRFTHDLVRRVAYAGLPFRRRRELHRRIGMALMPKGEPDDARVGLLALHFDGSGDHELAWRFNRMAGERARDHYASVEATTFLERAVHNAREVAERIPAAELATAFEALADVALMSGRFELAAEGLRGARRLAAHDPLMLARLCRKEGRLCERQGRDGAAPRWFRRGLQALEHDDAAGAEAAAERSRIEAEWASFAIQRQKYRVGERRCRVALELARQGRDRGTEAHVYYLLEWAMGQLGDEQSFTYLDLAQPIYEEIGDYVGLGSVLMNRGVGLIERGEWPQAVERISAARTAYERGGDVVMTAHAAHNLAEVYTEQGRHEEAETLLREARRVWRSSGFAMGVAAVTSALGRVHARSGRTDEGLALLAEAGERFVQLDHQPFVAETEVRIGEALVFAGRYLDAASRLDALGERAADGGPAIEFLARRMRALAAAGLGQVDVARSMLESVRKDATKQGIEWESAYASLALAALPGAGPEEVEVAAPAARLSLEARGVRVAEVLPPG